MSSLKSWIEFGYNPALFLRETKEMSRERNSGKKMHRICGYSRPYYEGFLFLVLYLLDSKKWYSYTVNSRYSS